MFFVYLTAAAAVLLGGTAFVILMMPAKFEVERSVTVDAPANVIFREVDAIQRWESWSPFAQAPGVWVQYSGPFSGVGSSSAWSGGRMGTGQSTIVASVPSEAIEIRLDMVKPMRAVNIVRFTFVPEKGQTRVTWKMSGSNGFLGKAASIFVDIEAMLGEKFEDGLHQLKRLSESQTYAS